MKRIKSLFFLLTVLLTAGTMPLFAYDQYESIKVGETKTFYFPSEVTSRASTMYAYNCMSDYINNVEVVSYTNTSVTVKALAFTQSTVNIRFDYWWYENNYYSRHDTHMVHLNIIDNYTPDSNPSLNPNSYMVDYGCWGTINVEYGSTKTVYCEYDIPNPDKVISIGWTAYLSLGFDIISQDQYSCTIRGLSAHSGQKLWCLMKYGSTSYKAYFLVNVTESKKETLTLSANTEGGNVEKGTTIYLTASQSDANIYYTLNGSTPTANSTKYTSSGVTINESCTLKAVAIKSGYNNSAVMTWVYSVIEDTDDTNAVILPTTERQDTPIYNFAGQRIENLQGKKGVFIIDGEKVLIK